MRESVFPYLRNLKKHDILGHLYHSVSESHEIASRFLLEGIKNKQHTVYISDRDMDEGLKSRLNNNIDGIDSDVIRKDIKFIRVNNPVSSGSFPYSLFIEQVCSALTSVFTKKPANTPYRVLLHKKPSLLDNQSNGYDIPASVQLSGLCRKFPVIVMSQFCVEKINSRDLMNILKTSPVIIESDYVYESSFYNDPLMISDKESKRIDVKGRLTEQEKKILRGIVNGLSNKAIAGDLSLSPRTVETHRSNIMRKLGVNNLVDLVKLAMKNGFV